jgi:hypothetical protein
VLEEPQEGFMENDNQDNKATKWQYTSKTEEEIKEIAKGIWAGQILTTDHENSRDSFMLMSLLGPEHLQDYMDANITCIYEHMSKAGPRSVNGMPIFMSHHVLNSTDHEKVRKEYFNIKSLIGDAPGVSNG